MDRRLTAVTMAAIGTAALIVGVAMLSVPAAFIVAGLALTALGLLGVDIG